LPPRDEWHENRWGHPGGFGLATLGAKIDRTKAGANKTSEMVSDIADRALRR
jgi:hypothetical protein